MKQKKQIAHEMDVVINTKSKCHAGGFLNALLKIILKAPKNAHHGLRIIRNEEAEFHWKYKF